MKSVQFRQLKEFSNNLLKGVLSRTVPRAKSGWP